MKESILVISNNASKARHLEAFFTKKGYVIYQAEHGLKALKIINSANISVIIYELFSEETAELGFFEYISKKHSSLKIIVVSEISTSQVIIQVMKQGAYDYILYPLNIKGLVDSVNQAISEKKEMDNKILSERKNKEYQKVLLKELEIVKKELVDVKKDLMQRNLVVELIYGAGYLKEKSLIHEVKKDERRIGKYTIIQEIGSGGMSVVYKAIDYILNREVAIKELTISQKPFSEEIIEDVTKRFIKEAQVIAMLRHDNIIKVFDVLEENNKHYMVMEYIEGKTLDKMISGDNKILPILETISIILEICLALDYIHNNNIIHRDVKPSNIIIDNDRKVKLMDFGVIRDKSVGTITPTGSIVGTMAYTAPEQSSKKIDFKVDIFPLGTIFYELLTGHNPFDGKTYADTFIKVASFTPPPPSTINSFCDEILDSIVMKALEKNPAKRYTAKELYNTLKLYVSSYEIPIA